MRRVVAFSAGIRLLSPIEEPLETRITVELRELRANRRKYDGRVSLLRSPLENAERPLAIVEQQRGRGQIH